jgi:broad specificity phosphatase PhoE
MCDVSTTAAPVSHYAHLQQRRTKSVTTANLVAEELGGLSITVNEHLRETQRQNVPYYADANIFHQAIQAAMDQPEQLLFGEETFEAARVRFTEAVRRSLTSSDDQTIALVSHATIVSMFIAGVTGMNPYVIWAHLDMPAYVIFTLPELKLNEICFSLPAIQSD